MYTLNLGQISSALIAALDRFIARLGLFTEICSNCGYNYVGSSCYMASQRYVPFLKTNFSIFVDLFNKGVS